MANADPQSRPMYWAGSAAVGAALAVMFWILQANDARNHGVYLAAAITCTALGVISGVVAIVRKATT
jgi:hypothetical protein